MIELNFKKQQFIFLSLSFILLWQLFPVAGTLDLYLIHPWITVSGDFFLKQNWYLETLNHRYVKNILIAVYFSFLALFLASFKLKTLFVLRWRYAYLFIVVVLSTSLIGILKSQSEHAYPWNMIASQPQSYTWIFNKSNGHCFPGGHAATGFALMVGYFVYRNTDRKRALFYLMASIVLGFLMGWAQMMRGAHFLSHNLWTGWCIWLFNVVVYSLSYPYFKHRFFEDSKEHSNLKRKT